MIISKQEHISFLEQNLLGEINKVVDNNQSLMSFILMAQAIEILGSYFDSKPIRAKHQSSKRFAVAINRLFGSQYRLINKNNFLYYQLRTCLLHMFVPTNKIELLAGFGTKDKPHLAELNDVITLYNRELLKDFSKAVRGLNSLIENDKVRLKKISNGLYHL